MSIKGIREALSSIERNETIELSRLRKLRETTSRKFADAKAEAELFNYLLSVSESSTVEKIRTK
jgi:uncharacterized protein YbcV (DUF1398 family)